MNRLAYIILGLAFLSGCKKQVPITDETDFELEINRDEFSDTIYWVDNLNVISTNDSVINTATFKLTDNDGNILYENLWQEARNYTFGLPDRKFYNLNAMLFLSGSDTLASEEILIDNNDYPDAIKINSITINSSVLSNDGTYYVSNVHGTLVRIYHALDAIYDSENYDVELATIFYQKQFSPKNTIFNFSNLNFPTRSIERSWRFYEVRVGFPIVIGAGGSSVVNDREVIFSVNIEDLVKNGNSSANVSLYFDSSDSSEGGIYSGTIEYEWIYEN